MTKGGTLVLRIYFALVAAVTLFTLMYGTIDFLAIGLKTYVFKAADVPAYGLVNCDGPEAKYQYGMPVREDGTNDNLTPEETKERCAAANAAQLEQYQREKADSAVRNLALIIVSLPLFLLHFRVVYRDWKHRD